MARPVLENEDSESEDERSQTYSSNVNLDLDNGQQDVPLAGKGPTMVGMFFKCLIARTFLSRFRLFDFFIQMGLNETSVMKHTL